MVKNVSLPPGGHLVQANPRNHTLVAFQISLARTPRASLALKTTMAVEGTSNGVEPTRDLTKQFLPNLDRHLVLPLLDFVESRGGYSREQVLKAKYDLLKPTNMVTYVLGLKKELDGSDQVPQGEPRLARSLVCQ